MAKLKLVTDVSKFGLLQSLAETRTRLVTATVIAIAGTYGLGWLSAYYILEISASVVANMLIITGTMFLVLITSFLIAVLVGDLTFPGPWRETVFLGSSREDLDRKPVQNHSGEFLVILVVAIIVNAFGINLATGGFLEHYHNVGYFEVRMRAEAPQQRVEAYETLMRDVNFQLWKDEQVQQIVVDGFDDPAPEVRAIAVWGAGKMELMSARTDLIELLRSDESPTVVGSAATALGKLGLQTEARRALEETLQSTDSPTVRVGVLRGLGLMEANTSVDAILPYLKADDEQTMIHAFWALRKIESEKARPAVRKIVDQQDVPFLKRCAAYDALKKVASGKDILWAKRKFQIGKFDKECPLKVWKERDGTKHRLVIDDSFREKLIKIIANEAAPDHKDWFQRIVNDPNEETRIREVASEVLRQLRGAE